MVTILLSPDSMHEIQQSRCLRTPTNLTSTSPIEVKIRDINELQVYLTQVDTAMHILSHKLVHTINR